MSIYNVSIDVDINLIPDDVVKERHILHHCVGGYIARVADHECVILFLCWCFDTKHSYYTIEIQGNKVVQVRGIRNCSATPEEKDFIGTWKQRVLDRIIAVA